MADCASTTRPVRRMICSDMPCPDVVWHHARLPRIAKPLSGETGLPDVPTNPLAGREF